MKRSVTLAFMLFSLVAAAQSEIKMNGSLEFFMDQTKEMDGKAAYSMNGDVFGTGDWKQATYDNWNDNRDKMQAILNLGSEIKVNDKVKLNIGLETMYDELIGRVNGSGETAVQELPTVRDNAPLVLKDITAEINSDFAKFTITNNFNYDFNNRVLAMQLEDNWGEPIPYGEGILAEKEIKEIKAKAFMFQGSKDRSKNTKALETNLQDMLQADAKNTKMVYGVDMKKEFSKGKMGVLLVNEHDKASGKKTDIDNTVTSDKDLDTLRVAVNGKFDLTSNISLRGEFITAQYGKDVTEVLNSYNGTKYNVDGLKDSANVLDFGLDYNITDNLQVTVGYKDIGEGYTAVLGNSQRNESWLGDKSFAFEDGTGYEKGLNTKISYTLPTNLLIKTSLEAKRYDLTRTAFNASEDTVEQEIKGMGQIIGDNDKWKAEASYRQRLLDNKGTGTVAKTDLAFDDVNANGEIVVYDNGNLKAKVTGDLNYYAGQDYIAKANFSKETRVKVGTSVDYKVSDKVSLKGAYSFGHATEDNDIIKDASATQNLLTMGLKYQVTGDVAFDVAYKYDNYKYDVNATTANLTNSSNKKEAKHQWYNGLESWDNNATTYAAEGGWRGTLVQNYKGYETHQLKASVVVKF